MPFTDDSVAAGVQVYVVAPEAISVAAVVAHTVAELTVITGIGTTVRLSVCVVTGQVPLVA